jgi:hypothetical protein
MTFGRNIQSDLDDVTLGSSDLRTETVYWKKIVTGGVEYQNKYKDDKMSGRDAVMINSGQL